MDSGDFCPGNARPEYLGQNIKQKVKYPSFVCLKIVPPLYGSSSPTLLSLFLSLLLSALSRDEVSFLSHFLFHLCKIIQFELNICVLLPAPSFPALYLYLSSVMNHNHRDHRGSTDKTISRFSSLCLSTIIYIIFVSITTQTRALISADCFYNPVQWLSRF